MKRTNSSQNQQQLFSTVSREVEGLGLGTTSSFRSSSLLILASGRQERAPQITVETITGRWERNCIIGPECILSEIPTEITVILCKWRVEWSERDGRGTSSSSRWSQSGAGDPGAGSSSSFRPNQRDDKNSRIMSHKKRGATAFEIVNMNQQFTNFKINQFLLSSEQSWHHIHWTDFHLKRQLSPGMSFSKHIQTPSFNFARYSWKSRRKSF